jgi:hypothetical protein
LQHELNNGRRNYGVIVSYNSASQVERENKCCASDKTWRNGKRPQKKFEISQAACEAMPDTADQIATASSLTNMH